MCEPTTIAAITVASAGLQAFGSIQQGNYQSAVARNNQVIAERAAVDAEQRGAEAEQQQRQRTQQVLGRQKAMMAANGLDISSGSAGDLLADTRRYGELDALTVRSNADREAYGYRAQAAQYGADAKMARRAGYLNAAGSLLTGASLVGPQLQGLSIGAGVVAKPNLANRSPWGLIGGGV